MPEGSGVPYPSAAGLLQRKNGQCAPWVCIEGMVQTTRRNVNGQVRYYQNIVGHELRKAPTKLAPDEYVCVAASVQTKYNKNPDGRSQRYETLIGAEISKIG